jgi:hypothetical protein
VRRWSSLPAPLVVLPLLLLAVILATQLIPQLRTTVSLEDGPGSTTLWARLLSLKLSLALLDALTAIALLGAPIYGWLLLICGWARRATLLWAVLPPFAITLFDKVAFHASHFAALLPYRVSGWSTQALVAQAWGTPGLWIGLASAAACLAAAIRPRGRGSAALSNQAARWSVHDGV